MTDFDVNVRAVVRATELPGKSAGNIPGWEVYDHDDLGRGRMVIRCSQTVTVSAADEKEAASAAKDKATTIQVGNCVLESAELRVDEAIDVFPAEAPGRRP